MKINKLFLIVLLSSCINFYTTGSQNTAPDEANTQSQPQESAQPGQEISPEEWQFLDDLQQKVLQQSSQIEFCLQTVEQIINGNKIAVNTKKCSKELLLSKIKLIKDLVQSTAQLLISGQQGGIAESIAKGAIFNTAFVHYLLPIFQYDIHDLDIEKFNNAVVADFQKLTVEQTNFAQITSLIEANEKHITQLISASENVGLSAFNKLYRYLDSKPLPFYGKSTFATLYDLSKLSAISLAIYGIGLHTLPNGTTIPFFNQSVEDLPGRKYVGNLFNANALVANNLTPEEKAKIAKDLKPLEFANIALQISSNPLIAFAVPAIASVVLPDLQEAWKSVKTKTNNLLNYYGHGDASQKLHEQDYVKAYFKDIIGGKELEKEAKLIADYIKNPTRYERQGNSPATGYLLIGPSQTGKSFFARALRTLIDEQFKDSAQKVGFIDISVEDVMRIGFAKIFAIARQMAPVILFIDELDMHGARRALDKKNTQELLTAMSGMATDNSKKIIVIAATNRPEELDFALKEKGRFGHTIPFDYPSYESRKQYLTRQLAKRNILISPQMIDTVCQETNGKTFNMIDDIIRQAIQLSTYQLRPVQEQDFEIVLDKEIRKIQPNVTMSQIEQELVAIYQAGQAVARQLLGTEQQVIKVTIDTVGKTIASKEGKDVKTEEKGLQYENFDMIQAAPRKHTRLGYVFTSSTMNHAELMSDEEQEKEILALLSGQAALELMKGKSFQQFGKEDRAKILDMLERKISQGTMLTENIRNAAIKEKDALYVKAKSLLQSHKSFIKIVADQLVKNHTINKKEWEQLVSSMPQQATLVMPTTAPVKKVYNTGRLAVTR